MMGTPEPDAHQKRAERVAAEIAQELPFPTKYPQLVDLLALAYLRGGQDALQWAVDVPLAERREP